MAENTKALDNSDNTPYEKNVSELENGDSLSTYFVSKFLQIFLHMCIKTLK